MNEKAETITVSVSFNSVEGSDSELMALGLIGEVFRTFKLEGFQARRVAAYIQDRWGETGR